MENEYNIEELITRYFNNELSAEEKQELIRLIAANPLYKKEFELFGKAFYSVSKTMNQIDFDQELAYQKFQQITHSRKTRKSGKLIRLAIVLSVAASIAALIITNWFLLFPENKITIQTAITEKRDIELKDGSKITLNGNSQICFAEKFKERKITLKGEAYFEVESDKKNPFNIEMEKINVVVIGTTFNIFEDSVYQKIYVTVSEGIVRVIKKTDHSEITVKAGETALFDMINNSLSTGQNVNPNYISWKTGILVFRDTPLQDVVKDLAKYYRISFIFENDNLKNCKLDTKIDNNKLEEVIEMLELAFGLKIKKSNNTYYISGKGC